MQQRIITGLLLSLLAFGGLLYLDTSTLVYVITACYFIALLELHALFSERKKLRLVILASVLTVFIVLLFVYYELQVPGVQYFKGSLLPIYEFVLDDYAFSTLWIWSIISLLLLAAGSNKSLLKAIKRPFFLWLFSVLLLAMPIFAWLSLHDVSAFNYIQLPALIYGLMIVIISDSGAYFTGKKFGREKLAPELSPNKTIQGLVGAIFLPVLILAPVLVVYENRSLLWACVAIAITAFLAAMGDLSESLLKRATGKKDAGNWLPGHGGLLDRFDSIAAALPAWFALHSLLQIS